MYNRELSCVMRTVFELQEVSEDKLPNQLCASCLLDMKDAYDFRLRCISSMNKLIKIIINHKNLSNDEELQNIYGSVKLENQHYDKNSIEDISAIKTENGLENQEDTASVKSDDDRPDFGK